MKKLINKLFSRYKLSEEKHKVVTMYDIGKIIYILRIDIRIDILELKKSRFSFTRNRLKGRIEANKEILAKLENLEEVKQ